MDYKGGSAVVLVLSSIGERKLSIQGFNGNSKSKADALQQMFELRDVIWEEKLEEDANEDQIRLLSDTHFVQCRHYL